MYQNTFDLVLTSSSSLKFNVRMVLYTQLTIAGCQKTHFRCFNYNIYLKEYNITNNDNEHFLDNLI